MKAGIYVRSATGDESALSDQEGCCRAYATARGWEVVAVWADSGSGMSGHRPGLGALQKAMASRHVDAVVATDTARIARDLGVLGDLMAGAQAAQASIVLIEGTIDPTRLTIQRIVDDARGSALRCAHRKGATL